MAEKVETLEIEQALICCQVCHEGFWYNLENKTQDCPHCGCRNYFHTVIRLLKGEEDDSRDIAKSNHGS